MKKLDLNPEFLRALDLIENGENHVFVTGRAGTGKSTLLEYFRKQTKKKIAVLAPTGVAALNIKGQTVHSFFHFRPDITIEKARKKASKLETKEKDLYKNVEIIVIDEISMARADLLDAVDIFLKVARNRKKEPFGGVRMIFIGDLYQLPPVVLGSERRIFEEQYETPYFFSAKVFEECRFEFIELEKIYRQNDQNFINILNAIRNKTIDEEKLEMLNSRVDSEFEPSGDEFYITLTPTNAEAAKINIKRLETIKAKPFHSKGRISGDFDSKQVPTEIDLVIKEGSQIMMLNNDSDGRWVNGTVGKIFKIKKDEIIVEFENNKKHKVEPHTWEIFSYYYDNEYKSLETEIVGSFTQYPLKLAWAVTIHKSQGKTFDKMVVDMGRGAFAHGQTYVALSRCTSLQGLKLKKPIKAGHVFLDWRIMDFMTKYQYARSNEEMPLEEKIIIIEKAIAEKKELKIIYLKKQDEKTYRLLIPMNVGEMEFKGYSYLGMEAFCHERRDLRTFRVDRILKMEIVQSGNKR